MATVREVTFDLLLRHLGLTTVFGSPGPPLRRPFCRTSPTTSATSLAFTRVRSSGRRRVRAGPRKPVLVNVHTAAGRRTRWAPPSALSRTTPLIITAGQQTREMLLLEPWLSNQDPSGHRSAVCEVGLPTRPAPTFQRPSCAPTRSPCNPRPVRCSSPSPRRLGREAPCRWRCARWQTESADPARLAGVRRRLRRGGESRAGARCRRGPR